MGEGGAHVQLVEAEQDAQNLDLHSMVQAAWAILVTKWPDIENEPPLKIADGGAQAPYCQKDMDAALLKDKNTYVCGINFAWVSQTYSAAPGVPVRMVAVNQV